MIKHELQNDARLLNDSKAWRNILSEVESGIVEQMLSVGPDAEKLMALAYKKEALDSLRGEIQSLINTMLETA